MKNLSKLEVAKIVGKIKSLPNVEHKVQEMDKHLYSALIYLPRKYLTTKVNNLYVFYRRNTKRHIFSCSEAQIDYFLANPSIGNLKKLQMHRGYLSNILDYFLSFKEEYNRLLFSVINNIELDSKDALMAQRKIIEIERKLYSSREELYSQFTLTKTEYEMFLSLRNEIIVAFSKLALPSIMNIPFCEDVYQNCILRIKEGLDLYYLKKGLLSNYLKPWIKYAISDPPFNPRRLAYNVPYSAWRNNRAALDNAIPESLPQESFENLVDEGYNYEKQLECNLVRKCLKKTKLLGLKYLVPYKVLSNKVVVEHLLTQLCLRY